MIGQHISHYNILEKLGEGGMGVVYKARDISLDRDVALKFLPRDLSPSEEERSRFIHEAKAASALDHPNICTIYEINETPDGQMYIVMGCYDGISLSKKIERGRLDVEEAVVIAIQIADGLQAAHEREIVHRDIKSSNIIITEKGQVKILDFGLAHKSGLSKLTKSGSTLGTAAYMSPEQARGDTLDYRSDLWSLGVVLYEMVTGKLPFRGEHEAAILYSVVNEEPQPIHISVPDASPELTHIIRRALEKNPEERYQSAADMLIDLRRLKKDTSRIGFAPVSGQKQKQSFRKNAFLVSAAALAVFCIVWYFFFLKKSVEINPNFTQRTVNVPFKQVSAPAISPDGKYLVFAGADDKKKWQLYIVSVKGGEPRQLTQDTNLTVSAMPSISPDDNNIVYHRGNESEICIIPFIGGTSRKIGNGATAKWSLDGKRIGYILHHTAARVNFGPSWPVSKSGNAEFWTMNPDGTDKRLEFVDTIASKIFSATLSFAWSPDSRSVVWERMLPSLYCEIVIHDLQFHKETRLVADTTWKNELCWASNDHIVYSSKTKEGLNLWTVSAKGGDPFQITRGSNNIDIPTVSADGKSIAFFQQLNITHLWRARLDGSNQHSEVTSDEAYYSWPAISPDGKHIAYCVDVPSSDEHHIYIVNRDGTNKRQLTFGETYDDRPLWSPDGKSIAYHSQKRYEPPESTKVYVLNFDKFETPRLVHPRYINGWRDTSTLEVYYQKKYWTVYLDGRPAEQFSNDSIFAVSVLDNKYVLFRDNHINSDLVWKVCKSENWDGNGPSKSWAVWKGATHGIVRNHGIYFFNGENELFRISFLDGKQEKVPAQFPRMSFKDYRVGLTRDGMEMSYRTIESKSNLCVIENLFK